MSAARLEHTTTIEAVDLAEWDRLLGTRGSFAAAGLRLLERLFGDHNPPENRWRFHYYVVRGSDDQPVLATFFTEALWKDDLFAPAEESRRIEALRQADPYLMTSRVLSMGSLLTEGNHLYLDRSRDWAGALRLLLEAVGKQAERAGASLLVIRDLPADDAELAGALQEAGFGPMPLPPAMAIPVQTPCHRDGLLATLPKKQRWELRRKVWRFDDLYRLDVRRAGDPEPTREELAHCYRLYRNVKDRGLDLNTYPLPESVFEEVLRHAGWELLLLRARRGAVPGDPELPLAVGACFAGPEQYVPLVIGLDYRFVESHGLYRQALWHAVRRAEALGKRRVLFGMGAPTEKVRLGAVAEPAVLFARPTKPG